MADLNEMIVVMGGGGGVSIILQHLKLIRRNLHSIHTVFDSGGHTGQLREMLGLLAVGDIRRGIAALADDSLPFVRLGLMDFEFPDGVKFGNILIAALMVLTQKNEISGIEIACQMMGVKGKVYPISLTRSTICAWMSDNRFERQGEAWLDTRSMEDERSIDIISLEPPAQLFVGAYDLMINSKKIVWASGDPYTSILPITRVVGVKKTIDEWKKLDNNRRLILVINLLTKKAESRGWPASMFAKALCRHLQIDRLDAVIVNDKTIPPEIMKRYEDMGSYQVKVDKDNLSEYAKEIISGDFVECVKDRKRDVLTVRHSALAAAAIAEI